MRFIKAFACVAGSVCAFSVPFYDQFKSVVPFIAQMLLGWVLLFAGGYQLVRGVIEFAASAKGKE